MSGVFATSDFEKQSAISARYDISEILALLLIVVDTHSRMSSYYSSIHPSYVYTSDDVNSYLNMGGYRRG